MRAALVVCVLLAPAAAGCLDGPGGGACPPYVTHEVQVRVEGFGDLVRDVALFDWSAYRVMSEPCFSPDTRAFLHPLAAGVWYGKLEERTYEEVRLDLGDRILRIGTSLDPRTNGTLRVRGPDPVTLEWRGAPLDVTRVEAHADPVDDRDRETPVVDSHLRNLPQEGTFDIVSDWNAGLVGTAALRWNKPLGIGEKPSFEGARVAIEVRDPEGHVAFDGVVDADAPQLEISMPQPRAGTWTIRLDVISAGPHARNLSAFASAHALYSPEP